MTAVLLIAVVAGLFLFGYYVTGRVDQFLDSQEDPAPSVQKSEEKKLGELIPHYLYFSKHHVS